MALTTPVLLAVNAFDATKEQVFSFSVISGDQVVANSITIKDNETLATVYTKRQVTFAFENTVPAGTLTNGKYYQAYIVTENSSGDKSTQSNIIQFYCYTQPTFAFSNIASTGIIDNASYSFDVTYNQAENEGLDSYIFNLYSAQKILINTSGTKYNTSTTLPLTISHEFDGFDNNTEYYIEVNGVTSGGTRITTGQVHIYVQYSQPAFYSNLNLTNHCQGGYITVQANVVGVEGKSQPDPPIYVNNQAVDLTGNGDRWVKWDSGFEIPNDFVMRLWFYNAWITDIHAPISKATDYLQKAGSVEVELFNITNFKGEIIYGGVIYELEDNSFPYKVYGYIRVLQNKNDIHGYNILSNEWYMDITDGKLDPTEMCLIFYRFGNLYTIELKRGGVTTNGGNFRI